MPLCQRIHEQRRFFPGLLVVLLFFLAGFYSLNDYGITFDEPETFSAGLYNAGAITGSMKDGLTFGSRHELPGYYYWIDTLRGLFAKGMISLGIMDIPTSFHLIHLVLSAGAVFLLYLLVLHISGRVRIAFIASLSLALFPKFIAHSQNNPKDLPGLFAFVLALFCVIFWVSKGGIWRSVSAGVVAGIAMTTSVICFFVPVVAGIWLFFSSRERLRQEWGQIAILSSAAAITFFLFWPWLWPDPLDRLLQAFKLLTSFSVNQPLLFFGSLYTWQTTPWYYFLGSFVVTTPVLYLFLALAPASLLLMNNEEGLAPLKKTAGLGSIWCGVLVLADLRTSLHYDGVRHFLAFLPGFCLLIGAGAETLLLYFERRPNRRLRSIGLILLCGGYLLTAGAIVQIHPYQDAYLNEATNLLIPGPAEDYFEIEYWGNSYREGADWLNRHSEPNAVSYLVFSEQVNHYLKQPAVAFDPRIFFENSHRPQYFIFMNRKAFFDADIRRVEREYQPVFTVNRQKGTLLKIYKNVVKKVPET